jgi:hypothetical protein
MIVASASGSVAGRPTPILMTREVPGGAETQLEKVVDDRTDDEKDGP